MNFIQKSTSKTVEGKFVKEFLLTISETHWRLL